MAMSSFISILVSDQDKYYMVMASLKEEIVHHHLGHRLTLAKLNEVILEGCNYLLQVSYESISLPFHFN